MASWLGYKGLQIGESLALDVCVGVCVCNSAFLSSAEDNTPSGVFFCLCGLNLESLAV